MGFYEAAGAHSALGVPWTMASGLKYHREVDSSQWASLSIGPGGGDPLIHLSTCVFVCLSSVWVTLPIGEGIKKYIETHFPPFPTCPFSLRCHRRCNNTNNAIISQYTLSIVKLSMCDQLTFHAYIIQAAALASAEHFYSQIGGKRAATR